MPYCSCGRYYISPAPTVCGKCGKPIVGGCAEGDAFRVTNTKRSLFDLTRVLEVLEEGGMRVEVLDRGKDERDTGNVMRTR
jgi:hypothetical protein